MTATTMHYVADHIFGEIVETRMRAVRAALGGLRISDFVADQLQSEIVASFIEQRDIAPLSSRE
ncbi:hypothetical protein Rpal_3994 [Rhodopseudomonas palustris TIE-1]|uniref:hypothetical protein n=1 Tax=Rhodopseudomonas palustris TaxID=1076 RepID=UPI0001779741|nr:hypothetical protein [Rhodopseudomonas palustris]ACF02490.1 hypothetical protein Rpal_3994 [Rhodopseudomonas palustris TIE-1]